MKERSTRLRRSQRAHAAGQIRPPPPPPRERRATCSASSPLRHLSAGSKWIPRSRRRGLSADLLSMSSDLSCTLPPVISSHLSHAATVTFRPRNAPLPSIKNGTIQITTRANIHNGRENGVYSVEKKEQKLRLCAAWRVAVRGLVLWRVAAAGRRLHLLRVSALVVTAAAIGWLRLAARDEKVRRAQ